MKAKILLIFGLGLLVVGTALAENPNSQARRKILFFDLWKLDYWDNIELKQGQPRFLPEATYNDPVEPLRGVYFPSVWKEEETGKWMAVYSLKWSPMTLMAAESEDGIQWKARSLPDIEPEGGKIAPHHIFSLPGGRVECGLPGSHED